MLDCEAVYPLILLGWTAMFVTVLSAVAHLFTHTHTHTRVRKGCYHHDKAPDIRTAASAPI